MRVYYYTFHVDRPFYFDRFRYSTCSLASEDEEPAGTMKTHCEHWHSGDFYAARGGVKEVVLPLLQTCRQVYQEARHEIFKCNTFHFKDFTHSKIFTVGPLVQSAIRVISVRLHSCWSEQFPAQCANFCKFVSGFDGLRSAHIYVEGWWYAYDNLERLSKGVDDWEQGVVLLQGLGSLHWRGSMCRREMDVKEEEIIIRGLLHLRTNDPRGQSAKGEFAHDELPGDELRSLYWRTSAAWYPQLKDKIKEVA